MLIYWPSRSNLLLSFYGRKWKAFFCFLFLMFFKPFENPYFTGIWKRFHLCFYTPLSFNFCATFHHTFVAFGVFHTCLKYEELPNNISAPDAIVSFIYKKLYYKCGFKWLNCIYSSDARCYLANNNGVDSKKEKMFTCYVIRK